MYFLISLPTETPRKVPTTTANPNMGKPREGSGVISEGSKAIIHIKKNKTITTMPTKASPIAPNLLENGNMSQTTRPSPNPMAKMPTIKQGNSNQGTSFCGNRPQRLIIVTITATEDIAIPASPHSHQLGYFTMTDFLSGILHAHSWVLSAVGGIRPLLQHGFGVAVSHFPFLIHPTVSRPFTGVVREAVIGQAFTPGGQGPPIFHCLLRLSCHARLRASCFVTRGQEARERA